MPRCLVGVDRVQQEEWESPDRSPFGGNRRKCHPYLKRFIWIHIIKTRFIGRRGNYASLHGTLLLKRAVFRRLTPRDALQSPFRGT